MNIAGDVLDRTTSRQERHTVDVSPRPSAADPFASALVRLRALGGEFEPFARRLEELLRRREQGRFHLAVLGQFKRGKSTFLNALIGEPVLPTASVPVTAIPTFLRHAPERRLRVMLRGRTDPIEATFADAAALRAELEQYVTERGNPKNHRDVESVEVSLPSPLLGRGVVLIDTPGIGSTFRHNTEATLNFLPQCDAAVFLVSADPPMTETEVEFLKLVRTRVARLFFVLNKKDYLDERELAEALAFFRGVLTGPVGLSEPLDVFCVSSKLAIEARMRGDAAAWARSGLGEVERHLTEFLAGEKTAVLNRAVARKARDILSEAVMRIRLALRALEMPVEEIERRLGVFDRTIDEARRQRQMAADLLAGDHRRLHEYIESVAERLRGEARRHLEGVLAAALARDRERFGESELRATMAEEVPGFFEHHAGRTTAEVSARVAEALRPHQRRVDELIETVRRAAAELFEIPYRAPDSDSAFEMVRDPYWETHRWSSTLSPLPPGWLEGLMPARLRERRRARRWRRQIADLIMVNVENLRWSLRQSVDQTVRRFGSTLDARLADTIEATGGAIRAALEERRARSERVAAQRERLAAAAAELDRIASSSD